MLVYGDPQFTIPLPQFAARVRDTALRCRAGIDDLRTLLLQCGQLEQAVADAVEASDVSAAALVQCQQLTDLAAEAFVSAFLPAGAVRNGHHALADAVRQIATEFDGVRWEDAEVCVKVPEGCEFYTLYPEQFALAAMQFASRWTETEPVAAVIGIRSIGTSLGAVVAATLRARSWSVRRLTTRPFGHPFQREADLGDLRLDAGTAILIVDEGPGLSGSSMASVAEAAARAGAPPECIALLPGTPHLPGRHVSTATQRWWQRATRVFVPLTNVSWNGDTLIELLAEQTESITGSAVTRVADLSGGAWCNELFPPAQKPAAAPLFERSKLLCETDTGAVLWKFIGLGALHENGETARQAIERQRRNLSRPGIFHSFRGWLAQEWVEGRRLHARDFHNSRVIDFLARYVLAAAEPVDDTFDAPVAVQRLAEMLYCNAVACLGEPARQTCARLAAMAMTHVPTLLYGDGRMAPHEFVLADRGLVKTDWFGHYADHTLIGRQSWLWDVAGLIVEWNLSPSRRTQFLEQIAATQGEPVCEEALLFYEAAYIAFRIALLTLGNPGGAAGEVPQRKAMENYRARLEGLLREEVLCYSGSRPA